MRASASAARVLKMTVDRAGGSFCLRARTIPVASEITQKDRSRVCRRQLPAVLPGHGLAEIRGRIPDGVVADRPCRQRRLRGQPGSAAPTGGAGAGKVTQKNRLRVWLVLPVSFLEKYAD